MRNIRYSSSIAIAILIALMTACTGTQTDTTDTASGTSSTGRETSTTSAAATTPSGDQTSTTATEAGPSEPFPKIAIQIYPGIWTNALVWIATDMGFYQKAGIEVEPLSVGSGPQGIAALQSGSIQLAQSTSDNLLVSLHTGMDLKVVAGNFGQIYTLMANAAREWPSMELGYPENMNDVIGRSIGVTAPGASTEILAQMTVMDAEIPLDDVEFVAVGGTSGQLTALETDVVDAVVAMVPQDTVFAALGNAVTLVNYGAGEGPSAASGLNACFQSYFGLTEWVDSNPETVKRFVDAHTEAAAWANDPANFDELVQIMQANGPIVGVENPDEVAAEATRKMVDNGLIYATFEESCLAGWNSMLNEFGVIDSLVDLEGVVWNR